MATSMAPEYSEPVHLRSEARRISGIPIEGIAGMLIEIWTCKPGFETPLASMTFTLTVLAAPLTGGSGLIRRVMRSLVEAALACDPDLSVEPAVPVSRA